MSDTGPYRELPKFLPCPRCGELLERAFEDVLSCMRCEGIWITPPTAGIAFEDPAWPAHATSMWWKSALGCPECVYVGKPSTMTALQCEGVQIDRCSIHGLWLDRGELGRILRTKGHELDVLRLKLLGGTPDAEALVAKREEWRKEAERKRRAAEEYRTWLDREQKRRIAEAERRQAEERKALAERERERAASVEEDQESELRREIRRAEAERASRAPEPSDVEERSEQRALEQARVEAERAAQEYRATRRSLVEARSEISAGVAELEQEIRALRSQLHVAEARLEGERMRLRMVNERIAKLEEPKYL